MFIDETAGTGEQPTDDQLASTFAGFLSDEDSEDQETGETPPAQKKTPEPEPESEEEEASTEPADAEEGESEETDEETEEQEKAPQTYRVKVNGEEVEVTLDELQRGYSRTQDYTRKTQELAKQREAAEQHQQFLVAGRQQIAAQLTELEQALKDQLSYVQEPDWVKLQQENPSEFAAQWAQWSQLKERMTALAQERQKAQEAVMRDQQAAFAKQVASAREQLVELIPAWKDEAKAKAEKARMAKAAVDEYGYTEDELRQVIDPRIMRVLRDATLYRELQSKKPQISKKVETIKTATPGTSGDRKPKSQARLAKERLAQSGDENAFVDLLVESGLTD